MTTTQAGPGVAAGRRHAVFHPLRVASIERLTEDAVAVTFEVPEGLREQFRFRPGQHVSVRTEELGAEVRRNYSICTPATRGPLKIGVKRMPDGVFSSFVNERLQVGDILDVMTPHGTFSPELSPTQAKRYVAIAAGSGITPVLSILSTALEVEPRSTAALVYVNLRVSTIMFLEELEDLKNRFPARFQLLHVLDQDSTEVELLSGRLDVERLNRIFDTVLPVDDVDDWFLCGPLAMTDTVQAALLARGADAGHVHRELFHVGTPVAPQRRPEPDQADTDGAAVTVVLDGRSLTFNLSREGSSILEATLRARPDAPYACKNGVCGTCRARVLEGKVEMDSNYALEPEEVARGLVLTCQSHPVTDRVTVDFDQ